MSVEGLPRFSGKEELYCRYEVFLATIQKTTSADGPSALQGADLSDIEYLVRQLHPSVLIHFLFQDEMQVLKIAIEKNHRGLLQLWISIIREHEALSETTKRRCLLDVFSIACSHKNTNAANLVLQNGLDKPDRWGVTALLLAIRSENYLAADALITMNADVNAVDHLGCSPLIAAAAKAPLYLVERLLRYGAKPNYISLSGESALTHAHSNPNPEVYRLLIRALTSAPPALSASSASSSAALALAPPTVVMEDKVAEKTPATPETPVFAHPVLPIEKFALACERGDFFEATALVEKSENIHTQDATGKPPLLIAASASLGAEKFAARRALIKKLKARGERITQDQHSQFAAALAKLAESGEKASLSALCKLSTYSAQHLAQSTHGGENLAVYAVRHGHYALAQMLILRYGLDINSSNAEGHALLYMIATKDGDEIDTTDHEFLEWLLQHGAHIQHNGFNALQDASNEDITEILTDPDNQPKPTASSAAPSFAPVGPTPLFFQSEEYYQTQLALALSLSQQDAAVVTPTTRTQKRGRVESDDDQEQPAPKKARLDT